MIKLIAGLVLLLLVVPVQAAPAPAHITSSGVAPTADCGTVVGTDSAGVVTVVAPTANPSVCLVTFHQAWSGPVPPVCLPSFVSRGSESISGAEPVVRVTPVAMEFHYGDLGTQQADQLFLGDTFSYLCVGH